MQVFKPSLTRDLIVVSKTADYTIGVNDDIILGNSSGAGFTLTLPSAATCPGKVIEIINTNAGSNAITLNTTSSQTIGGISSGVIKLATTNDSIKVVSDNSNWQINDFGISVALYLNGTPTGTINGSSTITYPTAVDDPYSMHSSGTVTIKIPGRYIGGAGVKILVTTGSFATVLVKKGGSAFNTNIVFTSSNTTNNFFPNTQIPETKCAINDTFVVNADGNGSPAFAPGEGNFFWLKWVGW